MSVVKIKMTTGTCDIDLHFGRGILTSANQLHDTVDDLEVEAAGQPALHEAHMHQWACAHQLMTPCGGVGYPPCLHKGPSCQRFMVRSLESLEKMIG